MLSANNHWLCPSWPSQHNTAEKNHCAGSRFWLSNFIGNQFVWHISLFISFEFDSTFQVSFLPEILISITSVFRTINCLSESVSLDRSPGVNFDFLFQNKVSHTISMNLVPVRISLWFLLHNSKKVLYIVGNKQYEP